jgi:hypothetical protein
MMENGLYEQWKHEVRYACGVEEDKHPQKPKTAADVPLSLKDMGLFFRIYAFSIVAASLVLILEMATNWAKVQIFPFVL